MTNGRLFNHWLYIYTTGVNDPVINTEGKPSTVHLKLLQLGEKGRELIQCLLERAKQLHDNMIKEIGGLPTDHKWVRNSKYLHAHVI